MSFKKILPYLGLFALCGLSLFTTWTLRQERLALQEELKRQNSDKRLETRLETYIQKDSSLIIYRETQIKSGSDSAESSEGHPKLLPDVDFLRRAIGRRRDGLPVLYFLPRKLF